MSQKIRTDLFGASADLPRITELDVAKILPNPDQPRKYFDEKSLHELADSIGTRGLLQPILVRVGEGDTYIVVAGERRYRAHKLLERPTIAAIITNGNAEEIALIENMQRENLQPLEEAEGVDRLIKMHGYTHEEAAKVVGKGRTTITSLLSILTLPEDILRECRETNIAPKTYLIALASAPKDAQREAWEALKAGKATTYTARSTKKTGEKKEGDTPFAKAMRAVKICTRTLQAAAGRLTDDEIAEIIRAKGELDSVVFEAQHRRKDEEVAE